MLEGLDVPVEHGRVRADAPRPCATRWTSEPLFRGRLVVRYPRAPPPGGRSRRRRPAQAVEPLRAASRLEHLDVGHPVVRGEEVDLDRGEALHVDVGLDPLEAREKLLVVREREARVQAVDDVNLARRIVHPGLELAPRFLDAHRASPRRALFQLREGAKEAGRDADIGRFDPHVPVEVGAVLVLRLVWTSLSSWPTATTSGLRKRATPSSKERRSPARTLRAIASIVVTWPPAWTGAPRLSHACRRPARIRACAARRTNAASSRFFATVASWRRDFLPTPVKSPSAMSAPTFVES